MTITEKTLDRARELKTEFMEFWVQLPKVAYEGKPDEAMELYFLYKLAQLEEQLKPPLEMPKYTLGDAQKDSENMKKYTDKNI